jgi:class 3 adenylate cyclase/tetratricopeptide (TPR) repeat protein
LDRVRCASCETENEAGRKFCGGCGARLLVACASCGSGNTPGVRFCGECGAPLDAQAAGAQAASPSAPAGPVHESERRLVSVLFADLVGFTTLAQDRDPEETRELLTRYFDLARDVVLRYGGVVEKFIGDAVMAVWGAPVANEDDAERAVRAGLELVDAVRALGHDLQARAGVLTGEAAVTMGAVGQGMVAGDLVNTASRLQSVAVPGTVLVGESTQRAAAASIVFEPAGEQILKGKSAPVPAWLAVRVVAERGGRGRSETLEAPFVGRDEELRLLKDLFHATGRERRTRLVSITGQGGIGKSRLAWEFLKYIDGLLEDVYWHEGRSPAYGDGITFWALGEMVRRRADLREDDDEPISRQRIAATLAEHVPDENERRWIEPALLALLGIGETPTAQREELFAAWRTFFERVAAGGTVAMVFEDLQWADAGLLDFIDHVLEWSKTSPIYVVTLARPELLERRPDWGAGRRNFVGIGLEPLTEPAMRQLLAGLVPGLPEAAMSAIVERADGIPLYAVETVRMLVAEGRLEATADGYRPTGDLATLAVPETLQALIAARLDGLDQADRVLVQDASVLGQSFSIRALAAVNGADDAVIEERLKGLVRRELLHLDIDPRSPERGQYAFVQALIREVAYGTLARRDRRVRHLAAARYFEVLGDDELAGVLAAHYLAAYQAAPDGAEGAAVAAQARLALRGAADRARALGSHEQVIVYLDQARSVTTDKAEQAELLEQMGRAASELGHYAEAVVLLDQAIGAREALEDRPALVRAIVAKAMVMTTEYRVSEAEVILVEAAERFSDVEDDAAYVGILSQLARCMFLANRDADAVAAADRALAPADRNDMLETVADLLVTKGGALSGLNRDIEGMVLQRAGLELAVRHGFMATTLRAYVNLSATHSPRSPVEGLAYCRAGIELAGRIGSRSQWVVLICNGSEIAVRTGDWDWATAHLAEIADLDLESSDRFSFLTGIILLGAVSGRPVGEPVAELKEMMRVDPEAMNLGEGGRTLAWVALVEGHFADATREALTAGEHYAGNLVGLLGVAGRAALWGGDVGAAASCIGRLTVLSRAATAVEIDVRTLRAGVDAAEGRRVESLAGYRAAMAGWREFGLRFDLALCGLDAVHLLGPDEPEVRAMGDEARAIFEDLGARPFLERLDAALAASPERARDIEDRPTTAVATGSTVAS